MMTTITMMKTTLTLRKIYTVGAQKQERKITVTARNQQLVRIVVAPDSCLQEHQNTRQNGLERKQTFSSHVIIYMILIIDFLSHLQWFHELKIFHFRQGKNGLVKKSWEAVHHRNKQEYFSGWGGVRCDGFSYTKYCSM